MATTEISGSGIAIERRGWAVAAVYTATIFLSAALLFCVEPMFAKMVLPMLGGSSAVWSIAMVVFQALLLAGYIYAHLLTRTFGVKTAAAIHFAVLCVAALSLPIGISGFFHDPPEQGIAPWLVGLFAMSIGLPFFAVAANGPLLQAWFARSGDGRASNPYFLYQASNAGSFAVLLAYPFLIEPALGLTRQSHLWTIGYAALVLGVIACATLARSGAAVVQTTTLRSYVGWRTRLQWLCLGLIPSGLLVAVTAHIATDVASAPFLWLIPLALYLLTFVFAFSDKPLLPMKILLALQPATLGALAILFVWPAHIPWTISLPVTLVAFFVAAMVCHTRLYQQRPAADQLTQFYVWMSLGGVVGGCLTALAAPLLFNSVIEYPILILAAVLARPRIFAMKREEWQRESAFVLFLTTALIVPFFFLAPQLRLGYFGVVVIVMAVFVALQAKNAARLIGLSTILFLVTNLYSPNQDMVLRARSFYGAYTVVTSQNSQFRLFNSGTTTHGAERVRNADSTPVTGRPEPLSYYYRGGAISEAIDAARRHAGGTLPRVAAVGLGMGALSCYSQPGESWTFYELDPLVIRLAENAALFRAMKTCAPNAATVIGDGRLKLNQASPGFDLIVLDAFSSDSIPVHMLTREAMAMYASKLAPHGVIAIHISNRNMELKDVVAGAAKANGFASDFRYDTRQRIDLWQLGAEVVVVTRSAADMKALRLGKGWSPVVPVSSAQVWTDDYSDVLDAMLGRLRG